MGEDGRTGLARPPSARRTRAARASRSPSWRSCSRSWVTPSSPGPCCRRSWSRPPWPGPPRDRPACPEAWVRGLADGSITAAVALGAAPHHWQQGEDGSLALSGAVRPVLGLPTARLVLVPLDYGTGTGWLLLDREALGDALTVEALPALDATRPLGELRIAGGRVEVPQGDQVMIVRRRGAGPGPDAGGGRERRPGPLVPGDRLGLRQGARPVRPPDRAVPGGEARAGRHAGLGGTVRRGGLGRGGGLERGRRSRARRRRRLTGPTPGGPHRRRGGARRGGTLRQAVHSDSRGASASPGSTTRTST